MHATDVLHYGHRTMLDAIDGLSGEAWLEPDVCGVWSCKDILAHLASFETVLVEVLARLHDESAPTPTLARFGDVGFNDDQVALRARTAPDEVVREYTEAAETAVALTRTLPPDDLRRSGLLPWYGEGYDLDDFLVYTVYGHKREHAGQIRRYRRFRARTAERAWRPG